MSFYSCVWPNITTTDPANYQLPHINEYCYNSPWSQTVPQNMPFVPINNSSIMRFSANLPLINQYGAVIPQDPCTSKTATEWELHNGLSSGVGTTNCHMHLKRRSSSSDEDDELNPPPTKKYMNEEKVAARFDQLSISKDVPIKDLSEEDEDDEEKMGTIIISDEAAQAMKSQDLADELIRREHSKNSKALVLWSPPIGSIPLEIKSIINETSEENQSQEEAEEEKTVEKMIE